MLIYVHRAAAQAGSTGLHRSHFDRCRLPDPATYYERELDKLTGRGVWRSALCPFHSDTRPSLRLNVETGGWRCMSCGTHGDLIAFQQLRYGQSFVDACKSLGAWVEGSRHG